jgi:HTH-type transcriptional regulator/antitoxin HigA
MARVIHNDTEHRETLAELNRLLVLDPEDGTPEADELDLLALVVETYERERYPIARPDPVDAIRFRMDQAGLSQRDLVPYMGSKSRVSEVLAGKRPLTLTMIRALNEGLGIPAEVLLQRTPDAEPDCEADSLDWARFPTKEMAKRGWFAAKPDELTDQAGDLVRKWFKSCGGLQAAALFRTSRHTRSAREMDRYALTAWTARILQRAEAQRSPESVPVVRIDKSFMSEVARLSMLDNGPAAARDYLAKNGVELVVEPHLPRTYLDGAAILGDRPVIGLTLRYDRLDNFWFTLMHELAHIALHDDDAAGAFYDDLEAASEPDPKELEADQLATDALIPHREWSEWATTTPHSSASLEAFARSVRVHPAVVAGRLRHESNDFRTFSRMLGNGRVRQSLEGQAGEVESFLRREA